MIENVMEFLSLSKGLDYNYQLLILLSALNVVLLMNLRATKYKPAVLVLHVLGLYVFYNVFNFLYGGVLGINSGMMFSSTAVALIGYAALTRTLGTRPTIVVISLYYSTEMCLIELTGTLRPLMTMLGWNLACEGGIRFVLTLSTVLIPLLINRYNIKELFLSKGNKNNNTYIIVSYSLLTSIVALIGNIMHGGSQYWQENTIFAVVVYVGFIVSNLFAYYLIYRISEIHRLNLELLASQSDVESRAEMVQIHRRNLEELLKVRHDMKNQFAYITAMAKEGRVEDIACYLAEYEQKMQKKVENTDCGNKVINSILTLEEAKANEHGLTIQSKILVPPELPFLETDLCSILTNVLDNAIEGTVRYQKTDPIKLVILLKQDGFLYISTTNAVGDVKKEELLSVRTTKENDLLHGYGTMIVQSIVRRYNGEMIRDIIDGQFTVDIMLDMLYEEKEQ